MEKNLKPGPYIFTFFIFLIFTSCGAWRKNSEFTKEDKKLIRQCNTARFSLYMGPNSIEIIRLCNIARKDKQLYNKYVRIRYGQEFEEKSFVNVAADTRNKYPLLRPSFCLWLTAKSHAIGSGLTAYEGHALFLARIFLFLNLNAIFTKSGENCFYGPRKAVVEVHDWFSSGGHRANILDKAFYRVGVAGNFHFSRYKYNRVQSFTGPKLRDVVTGRKWRYRKK